MASLQKVIQEPINGSAEFRSVMALGKPAVKWHNNSLASKLPTRYLKLANANLKLLSKNQKEQYKELLITHVTKDSVFLSLDDSEIVTLAKVKAERYQARFAMLHSSEFEWEKQFFTLNSEFELAGFPLLDYPSKKSSFRSVCLRLSTNKFWRKLLRTTQARTLESEHVRVGHVSRSTGQLYVSNEAVANQEQKRKRNDLLLESLEAENEEGYTATLQDLAAVSTANPELRRNEVMARLRGLEEFADKQKLVGEFYTITTPSKMHRYRSIYKHGKYVTSYLNKDYDGTTPRQAQAYLNKQWQKIRAELKRKDLPLLGMRVAEPHHDGTPHWHMLFFINKKQRSQIRQIFRHYALEVNPNEKGAQKHRFTAIKINKVSKKGKKQSAVGYIAKYISKNLSFSNKNKKGTGSNDNAKLSTPDFSNDGQNVSESINRVQAWSSLWGIRQFQQIGGERITVWRELRRLRNDEAKELPANFVEIHKAADTGNYHEFLNASIARKKIEIIRRYTALSSMIELIDDDGVITQHHDRDFTNVFEEEKPAPIIGLRLSRSFVITRRHEWDLKQRRVSALGLVSITVPIH